MKNFTTFREDLASGRPLKKPVSSNLLKQRKKENEKALKSGFMKMPDYVKKKFNEEEEMKPHKMYKGDKVVMAKNKAEHDKLNKQGYTHDNPKTEKVEEEKKNCGCGQDPCITYGKKQMKEAKKPVVHSDKPDSLKMVKIKYNKPIKTKVTDIGPGGKEYVRKDFNEEKQKGIDGKVCWKGYKRMGTKKKGGKTVDNCVKVENYILDAFENYYLAELSPKTISSYQKKAGKQYSDLKKTTPSRQDIENAYHQGHTSDKQYDKQHGDRDKLQQRGKGLAMSKGKGVQKEGAMKRLATDKAEKDRLHLRKLKKAVNSKPEPSAYQFKDGKAHPLYRKEQKQIMVNLDLDESIANLVKRGVGRVKDSLQQAGQQYVDHQQKQMKAGKGIYSNPVSGDNIRKRREQMQKKRN
jgi:hypothetical protein